MFNPIALLYEGLLKRGIVRSPIPVNHILLVLDETDLLANERGMERLRHFILWCHALNIDIISVYISVIHEGMDRSLVENAYSHLEDELRKVLSKENTSVVIYGNKSEREPAYAKFAEEAGTNEKRITISLGFGGKSELTEAVKEIVKKVEAGEVEPEEIDEKLIESELLFKSEPDLVIRSGATRLMDFLIWQSVYTEFYFTDMNWAKFRKIDLLRAVRDFKMRERRFGR
ncbi:MAG: undecaprenyl diphosphate synthase family protein [Euryarchaeota archaeon]|nr:undecaprenyl diphosphate synthase family protein [Euryarchaeota archaeon]